MSDQETTLRRDLIRTKRKLNITVKQLQEANEALSVIKHAVGQNITTLVDGYKFSFTIHEKFKVSFRKQLQVIAGFAPDDNITDDDLLDIIEDMIDA